MAIRGSQTVRFMQPGPKGDTGYDGCSVRTSVWQMGIEYHNDEALKTDGVRYLDVVIDRDVSIYGRDNFNAYVCRKTHTSSSAVPLVEGEYWEKADVLRPLISPLILTKQLSADYINVQSLAASQAFIDALTVKRLDTLPSRNNNKVVIEGDSIQILDSKGVPVARVVAGGIGDVEEQSTSTLITSIPRSDADIDCNGHWGTQQIGAHFIDLGQQEKGNTIEVSGSRSWIEAYRGPLNYDGQSSTAGIGNVSYTVTFYLYDTTDREKLYEEVFFFEGTTDPNHRVLRQYLSKGFTADIPNDGHYYLHVIVVCSVGGPGAMTGPYSFPAYLSGYVHGSVKRTNLVIVATNGILCRFGTTEQNTRMFKVSEDDGMIEGTIGSFGFRVSPQGFDIVSNGRFRAAEENGKLVFNRIYNGG